MCARKEQLEAQCLELFFNFWRLFVKCSCVSSVDGDLGGSDVSELVLHPNTFYMKLFKLVSVQQVPCTYCDFHDTGSCQKWRSRQLQFLLGHALGPLLSFGDEAAFSHLQRARSKVPHGKHRGDAFAERGSALTEHLRHKYCGAVKGCVDAEVADLRSLQSWFYEVADLAQHGDCSVLLDSVTKFLYSHALH